MNKFLMMSLILSITKIVYADNNQWTGLYAGVNAGYVFNSVQLKSQQLGFTNPDGTCDTNSNYSTFFPGLQLGYLYPYQNYFVSGMEINVTPYAKQNDTLDCPCPHNMNVSDRFTFKNRVQSAVKGRIGRAVNWNANNLLPYLTVGASIASVGLAYQNEGGDYYSKNTTGVGWLIGAGIEWAFLSHWSLRAEYDYIDYGNSIQMKIPSVYELVDPNGQAKVKLNSNTLLISVNYWI
jgi:outer membrane immunogenic protein